MQMSKDGGLEYCNRKLQRLRENMKLVEQVGRARAVFSQSSVSKNNT